MDLANGNTVGTTNCFRVSCNCHEILIWQERIDLHIGHSFPFLLTSYYVSAGSFLFAIYKSSDIKSLIDSCCIADISCTILEVFCSLLFFFVQFSNNFF
jgi:hypothetical protein